MTDLHWIPAEYPFTARGARLMAEIGEDVLALFFVDTFDYQVRPVLVVEGEGIRGGFASTESTQDWPEVERFIPRGEWPDEIYAGRRGPIERNVHPAIAAIIEEELADLEAELEADRAEMTD